MPEPSTTWLPWSVAALACALAAWSWLRAPAEAAAPVSAAEPVALEPAASAPASAPVAAPELESELPDLQTTQVCLDQLELARSALARCRDAPSHPAPPAAVSCLAEPQVAAQVEQRIEQALLEHLESERELAELARERQRSAFDSWAQQALALSPDESAWVEDYVCAVLELRANTLATLEDETPPAEALAQLKSQRKQLLTDMKQMLGEERYATLRSIGGLSLIASVSECP